MKTISFFSFFFNLILTQIAPPILAHFLFVLSFKNSFNSFLYSFGDVLQSKRRFPFLENESQIFLLCFSLLVSKYGTNVISLSSPFNVEIEKQMFCPPSAF